MSSRSCEYDLARLTLLFLLPIVHVVQYWGYVCDGADILVHADADIIDCVARFADYYGAPAFMIMMGINMLFTRHNTPRDFLRRGLILLGVELLFNLVRYVLPAFIGFAIGHYRQDVMDYAVYGIFNSDILAFAGLAFILMAGMKKLRATPHAVLLTALLMWIAGWLLTRFCAPWLCSHCSDLLLNMLGSFVWVNADSNFPLLSWMIYPAIGYCFMDALRGQDTAEKKEKIWQRCGLGGMLLAVLLFAIALFLGQPAYETLNVNGTHHCPSVPVLLTSTGLAFLLLYVCHLLAAPLRRCERLERLVIALGSHLTSFYILQWIFVGWGLFLTGGTDLWGCQSLTFWPTVGAIALIALISAIPAFVSLARRK